MRQFGEVFRNPTFGAIVACVLWSMAFVFIKLGAPYFPTLQFAGVRFMISGIVLLPLAYRTMGSRSVVSFVSQLRPRFWRLLALGTLQIGLKYAFFYWGLMLVPAALAAMITGSNPMVVALVAHFFQPGDRLSWRKAIAMVGGAIGVLILTLERHELGAVGSAGLLGILLLLGTNTVSAFGDIWVSREAKRINSTAISSTSLLTGGIALLLAGWSIEGVHALPSVPIFYVSLAVLCTISAGAFTIWFRLLQRKDVEVSSLNMWKFLMPLVGAVLAWIVMPNEHPTLVAVVGMLFIVASLMVLQGTFERLWRRRRLGGVSR